MKRTLKQILLLIFTCLLMLKCGLKSDNSVVPIKNDPFEIAFPANFIADSVLVKRFLPSTDALSEVDFYSTVSRTFILMKNVSQSYGEALVHTDDTNWVTNTTILNRDPRFPNYGVYMTHPNLNTTFIIDGTGFPSGNVGKQTLSLAVNVKVFMDGNDSTEVSKMITDLSFAKSVFSTLLNNMNSDLTTNNHGNMNVTAKAYKYN